MTNKEILKKARLPSIEDLLPEKMHLIKDAAHQTSHTDPNFLPKEERYADGDIFIRKINLKKKITQLGSLAKQSQQKENVCTGTLKYNSG